MKSIQLMEQLFCGKEGMLLENRQAEPQNLAYEGFTFSLNHRSFRHRRAKKTPKKQGYFVVFWEKDMQNKNQAYSVAESLEITIVTVIDQEKVGQFLFPRAILQQQGILRSEAQKGKMGIRVYPTWELDLNKNAQQIQKWQAPYFIDLSKNISEEELFSLYFD